MLIDGKRLVLSWPGRNIHQTRNIGQMQGRVQKYFVDSDPDELRRSFDITVSDAEKRRRRRPCRRCVPKRKQIREGLTPSRFVDRSIVAAARGDAHDVCDGDTKLMTLEDVVPNAPIAPGTFAHPPQTTR